MLGILDIATIMVCTAFMTLVVALALTFMWYFERREEAVGWWCLAMWGGTVGSILLAFRATTPWWFGIGLGNAAVMLAYALATAGFASFAGKRMAWPAIMAGLVFWVVSVYGFHAIRSDVNVRIIIGAIILTVYCALMVGYCWRIWQQERLPSSMAAAFIYATHCLFYLVRVPFAIFAPVADPATNYGSTWFAVVNLEAFIHVMLSSFVLATLVRERSERRYRLAAEIDALTLVASRRHFVSETRKLLAAKPKFGALVVMDLDFFKKTNDTYGHMAGDRVLQLFARHVAAAIDEAMVFGRMGGEEFGLFIAGRSDREVAEFTENLRASVEDLDIWFNGHVLKVTTSMGIASVAEAGYDFDHLMAGADNALYVSKREGRNRASFFHPAMRLQTIIEGGQQSRVSLSKKRLSRISVRNRPGNA